MSRLPSGERTPIDLVGLRRHLTDREAELLVAAARIEERLAAVRKGKARLEAIEAELDHIVEEAGEYFSTDSDPDAVVPLPRKPGRGNDIGCGEDLIPDRQSEPLLSGAPFNGGVLPSGVRSGDSRHLPWNVQAAVLLVRDESRVWHLSEISGELIDEMLDPNLAFNQQNALRQALYRMVKAGKAESKGPSRYQANSNTKEVAAAAK